MKFVTGILIILLLSSAAWAEQNVRLGYIGAPLSYTSLSVLKVAYEKIGYTVEAVQAPGERSLTDSAAGLTDGEVHRIKAIESQYPSLIRIDIPINHVEGMLISCNKEYQINSVDELKGYRVAVRIGNKYAVKLTEHLPNVIRTPDAEKMMELLLQGRADFILSDRPWAMSQQKIPGQDYIIINEPPLVSIPLYHYVHQKNKGLVLPLARTLRAMEESGESEKIRQKALKEALQTQ